MLSTVQSLALAICLTAIQVNSTMAQYDYDSLTDHGLRHLESNDLDSALIEYSKAYGIYPNGLEANYGLGVCYLMKCRLDSSYCLESLSFLNFAIQTDDSYRNPYFNRGKCKEFLGDLYGAIDDYQIAIRRNSSNPNYYISRAMVYSSLGRKKEACRDLKSAKELSGNLATPLILLEKCD